MLASHWSIPADEQYQAGGEEAAGRDSEEHQEDGLGGHKVISPHNKVRRVGRVETWEPETIRIS